MFPLMLERRTCSQRYMSRTSAAGRLVLKRTVKVNSLSVFTRCQHFLCNLARFLFIYLFICIGPRRFITVNNKKLQLMPQQMRKLYKTTEIVIMTTKQVL